jgi:ATP-dependent Zn protease
MYVQHSTFRQALQYDEAQLPLASRSNNSSSSSSLVGGMLNHKAHRHATGSNVTFSDVKGIDEVKRDLVDIVEYLSNPQKFQAMGAKLPKGILLYGPPGTGKTYVRVY